MKRKSLYCDSIKRGLAVILSFLGLLCFSWLYLFIIIAIKIDSPGPVLFKQKRVGKDKNYFEILKFRTMRTDTPHDMPTHMLADPDRFITRTGRFLRKTSLDELPQLVNILRGDMAIIGPRPALWNQYDLIAERERYGANDVRPGLTGWAQIHGRDELEIKEKAKLDGYYVEHMGFAMDVRCFFGTIVSVLHSDGVVEGGTGAMRTKNVAAEHKGKTSREEKSTAESKGKIFREEKSTAENKRKTPQAVKKPKIVVITNHSYMFWQFRRELMEALMKENELVVSMPFVGHEKDFQKMGIRCVETKIDRRGINPRTDLRLLNDYRCLLKSEKPDLVITYSIKPNIYAGLLCSQMNIPYYANVQGLGTAFQKNGLAQFVTLLYKLAFRKVEKVFFENEANAKEFQKRHIIPSYKQKILPGAGINLDYYAYQPYPGSPSAHKPVRFLYLGRIMKEKGMDELFAAVRKLRKENGKKQKEQGFVLDLVGFFEEEYKEQVERLQKDGTVVFHGFQEDPRPFYAAADCIVLPSYHEGMSNVLLEAAAVGRPVITSNIPGCREAVEHGKTGLLAEVKSSKSLYLAMKQFLDLSWEERESMGKAGRRKMELEFEKGMVVRETVREIGAIGASKGGRNIP